MGMGGGFGGDFEDDAVVKLRGLPYDATQMQVQDFFRGELRAYICTNIAQNKDQNSYHFGFGLTFNICIWVLGLQIEDNGILLITGH